MTLAIVGRQEPAMPGHPPSMGVQAMDNAASGPPDNRPFEGQESPISRHRTTAIPRRFQPVYARALAAKSRKAAIRAFCLECCGWDASEVHNCSDNGCPLYAFRSGG